MKTLKLHALLLLLALLLPVIALAQGKTAAKKLDNFTLAAKGKAATIYANASDWPGYHTHWTPHPQIPGIKANGAEGA